MPIVLKTTVTNDHPQLVLLSFARKQGHYILTKNEQF